MSAKVFSAALVGLEGGIVEVEADIGRALSAFIIVGLPDKAVEESKERIRSGFRNSGLEFPRTKITVNLAPADLKKEGPAYDLPIAVSILAAEERVILKKEDVEALYVGELSLDGSLRPVNGVLSIALVAKLRGKKRLYVPVGNIKEAALVPDLEIFPIKALTDLVLHLTGELTIPPEPYSEPELGQAIESEFDLSFVRGQEHAKRALEIAAAGAHNILMTGPPGSGKTLLARTLPTILPKLTLDEALEVTRIYSVAGELVDGQALVPERPFRSPHHSASGVAVVGGGTYPKPGEVSLAHRGVLFLDEFPEFNRMVLENLRQPLEDGVVTVSRIAGTNRFPAKFMLLAAMNPCPCGYATDPAKDCLCTPYQVNKYQRKVSGPLLDRIDLHIDVPPVEIEKLEGAALGAQTSAEVRTRVQKAREHQLARFADENIFTNAEMSSEQVKAYAQMDKSTRDMLQQAAKFHHLSARAYFRILKLARTIADLAERASIEQDDVAEALQYRPKVE